MARGIAYQLAFPSARVQIAQIRPRVLPIEQAGVIDHEGRCRERGGERPAAHEERRADAREEGLVQVSAGEEREAEVAALTSSHEQ